MTLTTEGYTRHYIFLITNDVSGILNKSVLSVERCNVALNIDLSVTMFSILV